MERGNIFFSLFGAVALVGVLSTATMSTLKGPVAGMVKVTDRTIVKNDLTAAATMISEKALANHAADCDGDGVIEPPPYRAGDGPLGGGLIPHDIGTSIQDPWKQDYGYCVWDHGSVTRVDADPACGGSGAGRLNGAPTLDQPTVAIISAGSDRVFETSCLDWVDANADGEADLALVSSLPGTDDMLRVIPYGQFLMPAKASMQLEELPDAACTSHSIGMMRRVLDIVQYCTEGGWVELSPSSGGEISFAHVTNALLGSTHLSNSVVFGNLASSVPVAISGGGTLSINSGPDITAGSVQTGDMLHLKGAAPHVPEATNEYTVQIGAVTKIWKVTTRDAYGANLTITPAARYEMNVTGPGSPAYGDPLGFILTNTGERPSNALLPASISPADHFEFYEGGAYVGDDCAGKILGPPGSGTNSCVIDIRPKASDDKAFYQASLNVGDGVAAATATLSGSASEWSCALPWGGEIANGASVTAYATSCSILSCTSQSRSCTNGSLSGSYQFPSCNVLLSC